MIQKSVGLHWVESILGKTLDIVTERQKAIEHIAAPQAHKTPYRILKSHSRK